jgi:hypothetical protein
LRGRGGGGGRCAAGAGAGDDGVDSDANSGEDEYNGDGGDEDLLGGESDEDGCDGDEGADDDDEDAASPTRERARRRARAHAPAENHTASGELSTRDAFAAVAAGSGISVDEMLARRPAEERTLREHERCARALGDYLADATTRQRA